MSASAEFVRYVRDQLASLGPLSDGMFFGGHAFKIRGVQFAMVMGNTGADASIEPARYARSAR